MAVPVLAVLVRITVALTFAGAVQAEQRRILGDLVARTAYDRVLDVAASVHLGASESATFFDRLQRGQVGAQVRPLVDGEWPDPHDSFT